MTTTTIRWDGTLTATASIAHGGDTRGTITLLRRELIVQPDGNRVYVPVISGNAFRGRLRRIGEQLLRQALHYEQEIPLAAAHALRGGGALAKTSAEPLSGRRLRDLRDLVPQIGVFGCAASGRIIDGCLQVGKLVPRVIETAHITGQNPDLARTAFEATQLETYVRADDSDAHDFTETTVQSVPIDTDGAVLVEEIPAAPARAESRNLVFRIETFPAGTTFHTWLRLNYATDLELAFFAAILDAFTRDGRIGGRASIGHGTLAVALAPDVPPDAAADLDWRQHLRDRRDDILAALQALT